MPLYMCRRVGLCAAVRVRTYATQDAGGCGHVSDGGGRLSSQRGAVLFRRARDEELINEYFVFHGKKYLAGETCVGVSFGGLYIHLYVYVCA